MPCVNGKCPSHVNPNNNPPLQRNMPWYSKWVRLQRSKAKCNCSSFPNRNKKVLYANMM